MHGTIAVSRHTTLLHVNGTRPHRHRAQSRCRACTSEQPSQPAYQSTRDFINSLRATVHTHTPLHNTCCRKSTPSYQSQPTTPPQATATTPHTPLGRAPVRVLGVDFGTRRTGVAVSALGLAPRPLQVLDSRGPYIGLAGRILALAAQEHVNGIVVGLPVTRRGSIRRAETDSQQGRRCRNFAITLATLSSTQSTRIPVLLFDEVSTSRTAKATLSWDGAKRLPKAPVDAVAAAELLSAYFSAPKQAVLVRPTELSADAPS